MLKFIIFCLLLNNIYANSKYESTNICKTCHPSIYNEFYSSSHRKSSIYNDSIHKAIWDLHPNKKINKYTCNQCHTPSDTRIQNALQNNKKAIPKKDNIQLSEAISCLYCHNIKDVKKHKTPFDENILSDDIKTLYSVDKKNRTKKIKYKEEKSFLGLVTKTKGSPYHNIDYTNNNFYTGKICMACHSHFENKKSLTICKTEYSGASNEKQNCITCHMPKIKGSATTIKITKTHTFHGFAGARNSPELLAKFLDINFLQTTNGFDIIIKNKASHNYLTHPLRLALLKVKIISKDKTINLETKKFFRILGKNKKPAMPWLANVVLKNTMLKKEEKRVIKYNYKLKKTDVVNVEFGYYLVNPKLITKLNLKNSREAKKYTIVKKENFIQDK